MAKAEIFKSLPPWAKGVVAIATLSAAGFVIYKVYKLATKDSTEKAEKNLFQQNQSELTQAVQQGQKPSYPISQYSAMANQIYDAIKYGVGDDYTGAMNTLKKMKNNVDVNLLVKEYGTRQLYNFGIPVGDKKDLFTAIRSELGNEWLGLSASKMDAVNKDWASKGITYRF